MRNSILIASGLLVLAAPTGAAAAPAQLSRADAQASARATASQVEHGLELFGHHHVSAKLDGSQRVGPRRFKTVVGLTATATRAGAQDGSCLFTIYTRQTRDGRVSSASSSLGCTRLFAAG